MIYLRKALYMTIETTEERLARVETAIEFLRENMATKSDLHELESRMTKWMAGLLIALVISICVSVIRLFAS